MYYENMYKIKRRFIEQLNNLIKKLRGIILNIRYVKYSFVWGKILDFFFGYNGV